MLLKREGLDSSDMVNYRSISNVTFISKIIEKIVAYQITLHVDYNHLLRKISQVFGKTIPLSTSSSPQRFQNAIYMAG